MEIYFSSTLSTFPEIVSDDLLSSIESDLRGQVVEAEKGELSLSLSLLINFQDFLAHRQEVALVTIGGKLIKLEWA